MFYHLDNFQSYDVIRASGAMDTTWLSRRYDVRQSTSSNLAIGAWSRGRTGLGTLANTVGQRSVYMNVGGMFENDTKLNISQKLLDFQPSSASIGGVSLVGEGVDDHILGFGFSTRKSGFVRYVNADGIVTEEVFTLPTSMSLYEDTLEWSIEKFANHPKQYGAFTLWVNNKPAFAKPVFCQVGSSGSLAVRVHGAVSNLAVGSTSSSGFLNSASNVTIQKYGTTDLVISDGARKGPLRVVSRVPTADLTPNTMTPSVTAGVHATVAATDPPDESRFLTAASAASEELFGAPAYSGLSSEAILAVAVQVVAQKNNPFALELGATLRLAGNKREVGMFSTDLFPSYGLVVSEKNPWSGLAWTPGEANAVNFGIKVF